MKTRTMIYLAPEQHGSLSREARELGISLAELIRRLADRHLSERAASLPAPSKQSFLRIVALGSSGLADISDRHDSYLGEALRRDPLR